jgi:hypothetical protein
VLNINILDNSLATSLDPGPLRHIEVFPLTGTAADWHVASKQCYHEAA